MLDIYIYRERERKPESGYMNEGREKEGKRRKLLIFLNFVYFYWKYEFEFDFDFDSCVEVVEDEQMQDYSEMEFILLLIRICHFITHKLLNVDVCICWLWKLQWGESLKRICHISMRWMHPRSLFENQNNWISYISLSLSLSLSLWHARILILSLSLLLTHYLRSLLKQNISSLWTNMQQFVDLKLLLTENMWLGKWKKRNKFEMSSFFFVLFFVNVKWLEEVIGCVCVRVRVCVCVCVCVGVCVGVCWSWRCLWMCEFVSECGGWWERKYLKNIHKDKQTKWERDRERKERKKRKKRKKRKEEKNISFISLNYLTVIHIMLKTTHFTHQIN